jgi:Protein of unknown function (DUF3309)
VVHGTLCAFTGVMETLAVIVALLVTTILVMPMWRYSATWGHYPTGVCGVAALALAALVCAGRL